MVRGIALALLLAAAAGWLALVAPARRERDRARVDYARVREERERLRTELSGLERRAHVTVAPSDGAAAGRALRLTLLHATERLPVEVVQLSATGDRTGGVAHGNLTAEGQMTDLLRIAERLVDPATGVRVERVALTPVSDGGMRLDLEGSSSAGSGS
jgi:hypothetical protein